MEFLCETLATHIVFAGKAVDRKNETEVGVGEAWNVGRDKVRFTPSLFITVVAVLQHEGAVVDGIGNHSGSTTRPSAQLGRSLRNIFLAVGAKIIYYCGGVAIGGG